MDQHATERDDTDALQAQLTAGLVKAGDYVVTRPLVLEPTKVVAFEPGVTIRSRPSAE